MGLPVIWSNITINVKRSNLSIVELFENENINSFRNKIELFLNLDNEQLHLKSKLARAFVVRNFSYEKITNDFLDLISREISYRKNNPFK
jgi:glycosyltransferase involved in cell wall biosynthesis